MHILCRAVELLRSSVESLFSTTVGLILVVCILNAEQIVAVACFLFVFNVSLSSKNKLSLLGYMPLFFRYKLEWNRNIDLFHDLWILISFT